MKTNAPMRPDPIDPIHYFDSTLLDMNADAKDLSQLIQSANDNKYFGICIYKEHLKKALNLANAGVKLVTVVSFPKGDNSTSEKIEETKSAVLLGADEIDMVMNIGQLFDKNYARVQQDIRDIVKTIQDLVLFQLDQRLMDFSTFKKTSDSTTPDDPINPDPRYKRCLKVIIETSALREEEIRTGQKEGDIIRAASEIVVEAGADFVKTSTGLYPAGGVHETDIPIIRSSIDDTAKIKAAGGIRTYEHAKKLIEQGADRIGTSKADIIYEEFLKEAGLESKF